MAAARRQRATRLHSELLRSTATNRAQDPKLQLAFVSRPWKSLDGNPNVWRQVLDCLVEDDSLHDLESALARIITSQFPDVAHRRNVARRAFWDVKGIESKPDAEKLPEFWLSVEQARLIHVSGIRKVLACEAAIGALQTTSSDCVYIGWPRHLVDAVGMRIAASADTIERLRGWLTPRHRTIHPLAVSLLHAARAEWQRSIPHLLGLWKQPLNLAGAFLDGAIFEFANFARGELSAASLMNSRFANAILEKATARNTRFDRADLSSAHLKGLKALDASFVAADLTNSFGKNSQFDRSDFSNARLIETRLRSCSFRGANFSSAILHRADLQYGNFHMAHLNEAEFHGADLTGANLAGLDLTVANFEDACFRVAELNHCNMEGMELPDADFESACLSSAIMTGSVMPRANFARAKMLGARLAEVDWESANLSGADLTGATFHMGSSRSGLVGSTIASYGSKTGFYTDDFNEQDFKSPEEIRKANLRGADLRGAILCGVDFYLVDLRDALYDADQEEQLVRTGAILSCRV